MKISQKHAILITNIYLSTQYDAQRLLNELAESSWKLGSIDSLLKRIHKTGTMSGNQAAEDCVRRVAVEDLVRSQVYQPKRHVSARESRDFA